MIGATKSQKGNGLSSTNYLLNSRRSEKYSLVETTRFQQSQVRHAQYDPESCPDSRRNGTVGFDNGDTQFTLRRSYLQ